MNAEPCCSINRGSEQPAGVEQVEKNSSFSAENMQLLPSGTFLMGSHDATFPADGEGPIREVSVDAFWIDKTAVTNADFAYFVEATNYVTEAERFGWSFVFVGFVSAESQTRAVQSAPWWRQVYGADWQHPEGPQSDIGARLDHPVVHVSWHDAIAFANWCGKRLPTEAEWEYAARGGLRQRSYPWGDKLLPKGKHRCNIWQGRFPDLNSQADGFLGTCPVDAFRPNKFGLYNMTGNVWEWTADWFSPTFHQRDLRSNPLGPPTGVGRVIKGGSYLCHKSYCNRYRVSARTHNTPDSSTGHMGFRLVANAPR